MHRSDLPPAPFDVAHASYTEIGQGAQAVHDIDARWVDRLTAVLRVTLVSASVSGAKNETREKTRPRYRVYV